MCALSCLRLQAGVVRSHTIPKCDNRTTHQLSLESVAKGQSLCDAPIRRRLLLVRELMFGRIKSFVGCRFEWRQPNAASHITASLLESAQLRLKIRLTRAGARLVQREDVIQEMD